jgi:hypothetical protein
MFYNIGRRSPSAGHESPLPPDLQPDDLSLRGRDSQNLGFRDGRFRADLEGTHGLGPRPGVSLIKLFYYSSPLTVGQNKPRPFPDKPFVDYLL